MVYYPCAREPGFSAAMARKRPPKRRSLIARIGSRMRTRIKESARVYRRKNRRRRDDSADKDA